ncbi:septum formation initiator family protein [bacterium]|nr:septum formation initiator family protein [bacterium]
MITKLQKFKRGKKKPVFSIILIVLALFFLSAVFAWGNLRILKKRLSLKTQIESLKNKLSVLKEKEGALERKLHQYKTDYYMEKIAREKLDLKKKGEKVVAFPVESESFSQTSTVGNENKERGNFWENFLKSFFGRLPLNKLFGKK